MREGFGNCFGTVKFEDLGGGVYITPFFLFSQTELWPRAPGKLADQHFVAETPRQETVDTQTAKEKEVKFRRRGESPHSYPFPPFPFCLSFPSAVDRSLGRESRRGTCFFKTAS